MGLPSLSRLDPTNDDNIYNDAADEARDGADKFVDFADREGGKFFDTLEGAGEDLLGLGGDLVNLPFDALKGFGIGLLDIIRPDAPSIDDIVAALEARNRGTQINKQSNIAPVPVIYGSRRMGGTVVFRGASGTENEYHHMVLVLCEGEVSAINNVYINDVDITDAKFSPDAVQHVWVTKHLGTDTQAADAELVSTFPGWTAAHQLKGVAYLHVKLKYNKDVFRGRPNITADIDGRKVYDTRTALTGFSDNPALCLYDYLTNTRFGMGIAASEINTASVNAAANECEIQVTPYAGAAFTQNKFACDAIIDTGNGCRRNIAELRSSFRAWLPRIGGQYHFLIDKDEASSFSFDTSNIIGGIKFTGTKKRGKLNRCKVSYANPDINYKTDFAPYDSTLFRSDDNGLLLETEVPAYCTTDYYRAKHQSQYMVQRSRHGIGVSFVATIAALQTRIGAVVDVTHPSPGWGAKLFRITGMRLLSSGNVRVTLLEHEPVAYNMDALAQYSAAPDTTLPDPYRVDPPSGLVLDGSGAQVIRKGDRYISRIKGTFTKSPDPFVARYLISYKGPTGNYVPDAPIERGDELEFYIEGVEDGLTYTVRVEAQNGLGYTSSAITNTETVTGKTDPPGDPIVGTPVAIMGAAEIPITSPTDADFKGMRVSISTGANDRALSDVYDTFAMKRGETINYRVPVPVGDTWYVWFDAYDASEPPNHSNYVPAGATAGKALTSGAVDLNADVTGAGQLAFQDTATWSTQITGVGKPADNADETAINTAAGIAGQGALATLNAANWQTQVTGTGKPEDNADETAANTAADAARVTPVQTASTAGSGLRVGSDKLGYFNGSIWTAYFDNSGRLYLDQGGDHKLVWGNGGVLNIQGHIKSSSLQSASFANNGTQITAAYSGGTTLTVADTTNFPTSGSGLAVSAGFGNNFSWTGKTATTLTGVSGLSSKNVGDFVFHNKGIAISSTDNEMYFVGDRSDGTLAVLGSIGRRLSGGDNIIAKFGASGIGHSNMAIAGYSNSSWALYGYSLENTGVRGASANGYGGRFRGNKGAIQLDIYGTGKPIHSANTGTFVVDAYGRVFINYSGSTLWRSMAPSATVVFDGSAVGTTYTNFNVSSVGQNSTGDYTINFTNAMSNSLYCFQLSSRYPQAFGHNTVAPTATSLRIKTTDSVGTLSASKHICLTVWE